MQWRTEDLAEVTEQDFLDFEIWVRLRDGARFHRRYIYPHLTLAQYDLPCDPVLQQRALDLCDHVYAKLPAHAWQARDLQFIRFESQDWPDRWWETLRFRQLKGWRLGE